MGRPVLAFNHVALELIKDNKNGILSKTLDVNELAKNIKKSLSLSIEKEMNYQKKA